jgi:diaminohydroxyphosphoribosylaminopyrimidine deaminase/5-amino-6-(5-phosphoribosylamino)uracil reductase
MSLDGKIASAGGDSKWISGRESREVVHRLRGRMDAILVGAGTVRADDPMLIAGPAGPRTARRVVLSSTGVLPPGCQLLRTARDTPVLVATVEGRGGEARDTGCEVLELPAVDGRPSVAALLAEMGRRRLTNLLVEGGAGVFGSFCDARLVDEFHVFVAPTILGGLGALSPVGGRGAADMSLAWPLTRWDYRSVGRDVYLHGWAHSDESA